ncbi:LCP family protein [Candidatus Saccharibacteria bacterium]|nr:LCP family protein [Candidatus Saccharibacteria bacterium]
MRKKSSKKLAMDATVPSRGYVGVSRRDSFPDVGRTLSTYRYDAFQHKPAKKLKKRRWTKKKIGILIALPFILVGLWLGIKFAYNASKIFNGNLFGIFTTTKLKGEDQGRVNILMAGNSADDVGHNGATLTDSIMIVSIDTVHNTAVMLSVPRDLYVNIPGYGHAKINEAYVDGERGDFSESGYAKGGMGLLQKTIYESLGIKTHYYALVNYTAFKDAVDAVGGIDVTINSSNSRGLYDPSKDWSTGGPLVNLSNGTHHLTGHQALNLSRARGDAYGSYGFANSDFTRTSNQRMMLLALKKKALSGGTLANPAKLSSLADALGKNVRTDFQISELRRLYDIMKHINNGNIKSYGLNDINGTNYLASYRNSRGQSTLIPAAGLDNFTQIQQVIRRLTSNNPLVREDAMIVVLNATDTNGVASENQSLLISRGMSVTNIADASSTQATSQIIDASSGKKPKTLAALEKIYGNNVLTSNPYASRYPDADFIILVGQDKV